MQPLLRAPMGAGPSIGPANLVDTRDDPTLSARTVRAPQTIVLTSLILLSATALSACGGPDAGEAASTDGEAAVAFTVSGVITSLDGPLGGAFVLGLDAQGRRMASVRSASDGTYSLGLAARPATVEVKAFGRLPWTFRQPALRSTAASNRFRFDVNVGPPLGSDTTGENLTFMMLRSDDDVRIVPQVAWGSGGALEPPLGELADLAVGPRHRSLTTLLPLGVRVPVIEDGVIVHADHLEVRLSRELNQHNLGSAYLAGMIDQIAATVSHNYSEDGLPVRIRVACSSCPGGFEALRDGAVGPTGPSESYEVMVGHPAGAFSDTYGHRYANHLAQAKAMGIATGYADGTDRPSRGVTRAELAAMLVQALGLALVNPATPSYRDVPRTSWAYRAIETARVHGIIAGSASGLFQPTVGLTRAELAAFLVNAARWPVAAVPARPTFTDVPATYWAAAKIETAYGWCHTVEQLDDADHLTFAPARAASRADAIAATVRMLQCLVGNEPR